MGKGIIIFRSKYGATERYARWLQQRTGFDCEEQKRASAQRLESYGTVIFCGGIYASGIAGLSFLKKNIRRMEGRKIAVFCVGASPCDEKAIEEVRERNFKDELKQIPLFYGRGMWDLSKMNRIDRTMCRILQKSVAKKDPDTYEPWMKALMDAAEKSCDWTDEKYLLPLLEFLGVGF